MSAENCLVTSQKALFNYCELYISLLSVSATLKMSACP